MGASSSSLDTQRDLDSRPIEVDDPTLEWLLQHRISTGELSPVEGERSEHLAALRADLPSWLGGKLSAEECLRRSNVPANYLDALRDCLTLLERGQSGSSRSGHCRRTIYTQSKNAAVGEEVAVVHVYEVLPPLSRPVTLYQMGP